MVERLVIRSLVMVIIIVAVSASIWTPIPADASGSPALPGPAFGQAGLYRLEMALLVFYGGLLLITPAFSGLIRGQLPIEISTRGARFSQETDQSAEAAKAAIENLEQTADSLTEGLAAMHIEIGRLKETSSRDNRHPEIDSNS